MKKLIFLSFLGLLSCGSENTKVEGKVMSKNREALHSVMVQVMGTDLYAYTDEDGNFAINTKQRGDELIFTLEGFEMQRATIEEDKTMTVVMEKSKVSQDTIPAP